MRVKDPLGPYDSPRRPAAAAARRPAEGRARRLAVYWEGIDNDGDGFFNEDPARRRRHQSQLPAPVSVLSRRRRPAHGERGRVARRARLRRRPPQHRRRPRPSARATTWSHRRPAPAAHAPASILDLVAFANQSVAGARDVGRFETPLAFGGRGGRGGGGGATTTRRRRGRGGRGAAAADAVGPTPPATTVNAADVEFFRT